MDSHELILFGKIDGKLDGITEHLGRQNTRLTEIDGRLRTVEQRAAVLVAVGIVSITVATARAR